MASVPQNHKGETQVIKSLVKVEYITPLVTHYFLFEEGFKKMKLYKMERQKLERPNSWQ